MFTIAASFGFSIFVLVYVAASFSGAVVNPFCPLSHDVWSLRSGFQVPDKRRHPTEGARCVCRTPAGGHLNPAVTGKYVASMLHAIETQFWCDVSFLLSDVLACVPSTSVYALQSNICITEK